MSTPLLFAAAFLACAVEMVEALTIVLALGVVRGWRSPLVGVGGATVVLTAVVAALGPALRVLPMDTLRLIVGTLLLTFGLQWLRKAILRASGYKQLRDEAAAFRRRRNQATTVAGDQRAGLDWYAFTLAFKGVLLEGLGGRVHRRQLRQRPNPLAARRGRRRRRAPYRHRRRCVGTRPLTRVPENTIKFAAGVMLTSFGCFWAVEGAGVHWPGEELALLVLLAFTTLLARILVRRLQRQRRALRPIAAGA